MHLLLGELVVLHQRRVPPVQELDLAHLGHLVQRLGSLPKHELQLAKSAPPFLFDLWSFHFYFFAKSAHQIPASRACSFGWRCEQHWLSDLLWKCFEVFTLFRKWTRWVVIGRRIDSAGVLLLSLRYLRWCHAYIQDNVKQDGMWWKSKGISFVIMYHLSRRWTSFPMLTSASLKNYSYKFWSLWRISPEEGQFCSINLWWYRSVAVPWVNNKHQNLPFFEYNAMGSYFWAPK